MWFTSVQTEAIQIECHYAARSPIAKLKLKSRTEGDQKKDDKADQFGLAPS